MRSRRRPRPPEILGSGLQQRRGEGAKSGYVVALQLAARTFQNREFGVRSKLARVRLRSPGSEARQWVQFAERRRDKRMLQAEGVTRFVIPPQILSLIHI